MLSSTRVSLPETMNYFVDRKMSRKAGRIFLRKEIDTLFEKGISFRIGPLRIVYLETEFNSIVPTSVLVSVSKKEYKQAVKRNQIKRWIKEAYRLHKNILHQVLVKRYKTLQLAFVFTRFDILYYSDIEVKIIKALHLLIQKISCYEHILKSVSL